MRISQQFFWKGLRNDVKKFVKSCMICQQAKNDHVHPSGLLQPLPIPQQILEDLSMDFIVGLPISKGFSVILVVVDRLSKFGYFIPLKAEFTSVSVAEAFIQNVVKLHGIPKSIVSDRDKVFLSRFWRHLFQSMGTTLSRSTAYHPQTDGQTESLNKCLEQYLRCFVSENPRSWVNYLPWAQYWYNTAYHCSAEITPFQIVYGRVPPAIIAYNGNDNDPIEVSTLLQQRDKVLQQLKQNLWKAQVRMKKFADKKRSEVSFEIGDWVFVKLQPYRQHSMALRKNQKLGMRFFGPFKVIQRIGQVAYKLQLPEDTRIHPVFHVSILKKCEGDPTDRDVVLPLPLKSIEEGPYLQPKTVLQFRELIRNGRVFKQALIRWDEHRIEDDTWEDWDWVKSQFPDLEDKVEFDKGGDVMTVGKSRSSVLEGSNVAPDPINSKGKHVTRAWCDTSEGVYSQDDWSKRLEGSFIGGRGQREKKRSQRLEGFVTHG